MAYSNSETISIGKLMYLFTLSPQDAVKLAEECGAWSKGIFSDEKLSYGAAEWEKIINIYSQKGRTAFERNQVRSLPFFDNLTHWAICERELDELINVAVMEYPRRQEFPALPADDTPYTQGARMTILGNMTNPASSRNITAEILSKIFLFTAVVPIFEAIQWLKQQDYSGPTRQQFEAHGHISMSWGEWVSLWQPQRRGRQGGSNKEHDKREKTAEACKAVFAAHIEAKVGKHTVSKKDFTEKVKTYMNAHNMSRMYHKLKIHEFFQSSKMEEYRTKRGRPRTNTAKLEADTDSIA